MKGRRLWAKCRRIRQRQLLRAMHPLPRRLLKQLRYYRIPIFPAAIEDELSRISERPLPPARGTRALPPRPGQRALPPPKPIRPLPRPLV